MNVPMSWVKEYVDIDCTTKEFMDKITLSGSKVESLTEMGAAVTNVVVGKILKIDKHPEADRLVLCKIDIGSKVLQVITAATNVFEGAVVPVALDGANLAGGLQIKTSKMRGQLSEGMLCSVEELGFTTNDYPESPEDGIYIFQEEVEPGSDVLDVLQMRDDVVEYEITSNRPDCFSVVGIAREAAATFNKPLKFPEIKLIESAGGDINEMVKVEIQNPELCYRYVARAIKNVKICPSPLWLRHKLTASGVRPINSIVDITNYVMLELGQPMHAFDIDVVKGRHIIVRNAAGNENFITLDGQERVLAPSMLVISDTEKALAIAGVMGGENSKITENASAVLLESACFNGVNIRLTAKKLGLRTDSSSIFEKGVDPNMAMVAVDRAAQLIEELGFGEVVKGTVDCYVGKREGWQLNYSPENINKLLGTNLTAAEMGGCLKRLGIESKGNIAYIPTYRPDLLEEADLAEEVARIYGYDNIKTTLAAGTPTVGRKNSQQIILDAVIETMVSCGLCEAMNYSFESPKVFDKLLIPAGDKLLEAVKIINPLGEDFSVMRTQTVNGMLQSLSTNYNRRNGSAGLFEISKTYVPKSLPLKELPVEEDILTVGMYGGVDFYNIKGIVETLFDRIGVNKVKFSQVKGLPYMHPGRSAEIAIGGSPIGFVGELHPLVKENYEINSDTFISVINLTKLMPYASLNREYKPLAKFPDIKRDIAIIVKEGVLAGDIESTILENGGGLIEKVTLFDVYRGPQIGVGMKSAAYNIVFRANDRTLKDSEAESACGKILMALEKSFGAVLRDK
ncbi:MAG: phenylalanine--tRNA ligase subunit beta [Clostridiales bacterium]|jgi:phenylalanyl-tRNA synthetase beta chain|nr:phenylalanine--tRNA ligase subunit beta [Clostridiales bacterium]